MVSQRKTGFKSMKFKMSLCLFIALVMVLVPVMSVAGAAGGLTLSTSFPGVTVKAGEKASFSIKVANDSDTPQNVGLSVKTAPDGWTSYFEGNSNQIQRVFVDKKSDTTVTFYANVPADAKEGVYKFTLAGDAGNGVYSTLDLELTLSKQELTQGKFSSQYPEVQGASTTPFKFTMNLANNSSKDQSYSLSTVTPEGWAISFAPSYQTNQISSLTVEAGKSQGLDVTVTPSKNVKAGKYTIPCSAVSAQESLKTELVVTITGTYTMVMNTASGILNAETYPGSQAPITLVIQNTGSADLKNVNMTSSEQQGWSVKFDPASFDIIPAGTSKEVKAYITAGANAIAGDYQVGLSAASSETSSDVAIRVMVKTPVAWGLIGIIVILILVGGLFWIFKKFGRR